MWVMNAICRPFRNIGSFCATLPYSLSRGQINARVCCKLKLIVLKQKQKFNTVARVSILRPSFGWKILSIKLDTDGETGSIFSQIPQCTCPISTMHHSEQKSAHFCSEWCIGKYILWEIPTYWNLLAICIVIRIFLKMTQLGSWCQKRISRGKLLFSNRNASILPRPLICKLGHLPYNLLSTRGVPSLWWWF